MYFVFVSGNVKINVKNVSNERLTLPTFCAPGDVICQPERRVVTSSNFKIGQFHIKMPFGGGEEGE